jgi:hypothetical protein
MGGVKVDRIQGPLGGDHIASIGELTKDCRNCCPDTNRNKPRWTEPSHHRLSCRHRSYGNQPASNLLVTATKGQRTAPSDRAANSCQNSLLQNRLARVGEDAPMNALAMLCRECQCQELLVVAGKLLRGTPAVAHTLLEELDCGSLGKTPLLLRQPILPRTGSSGSSWRHLSRFGWRKVHCNCSKAEHDGALKYLLKCYLPSVSNDQRRLSRRRPGDVCRIG